MVFDAVIYIGRKVIDEVSLRTTSVKEARAFLANKYGAEEEDVIVVADGEIEVHIED